MTSLIFRFATVSGHRIVWQLKGNGSVARARLWLCAPLTLALAPILWIVGDRWALVFAGLAGLCLVIGWARYVRHATDGERISLQGASLVVERETAGKLERTEFDRSRVRVEPKTGDRSLITLSAQGRSMDVGRFVRPDLRPALASEIRMALRAA